MTADRELLDLLARIEANQREALDAQAEHLKLAQQQFARSEARVEESLKVQRLAVRRQQRLSLAVLPLILFLIVLVVWIAVKWRIV
jgi:t-SNARE complex subunit (syntaxin)